MKSDARIEIQCGGSVEEGRSSCVVTVTEGKSRTKHTVTVDERYRRQIAPDTLSLEELLRHSFRFLLEREPKESILREFDLRAIGRYFPEYEAEVRRTLDRMSK